MSDYKFIKSKFTFNTKFNYEDSGNRVICYLTPKLKNGCWTLPKDIGFNIDYGIKNFKGVAVYKTGDSFDKKIAEKVAYKKAVRAFYRYLAAELKNAFVLYQRETDEVEKCLAYFTEKKKIVSNEIVDLTKE